MPGFDITESQVLKNDPYFQLQRVITRDGEEFLVKIAVTDDRGNEEKLLEREFELLRSIGSEYGLTSIRLARLGGRLAAVYEAFDGLPLTAPDGTSGVNGTNGIAPLDLSEFSQLAGDICAILAVLHGRGTFLLGVSPGSFLRHRHSRRLVLADAPFAQDQGSSVDKNEEYWFDSPYLAYAAPEVIGGASLPLDHRADLYALGGLLYHLLSHRPVFDAVDPAEIIQCHLARQPKHLLELVPSVPQDLANAVMKLLAKSPLDRFASVEAFEQGVAGHLAGSRDRDRTPSTRSGRSSAVTISFSTNLYGHADAANAVRDKVRSARSRPAVVFLEGDAGIGKTTLLREVQRLESHAHFCGGDFNRNDPARPLGGWTSALIDLANVVLTSRTGELEVWRARILRQLGEWAPLIGALAPEWQAILRCSAPLIHDPLDASLNRLALAIRRLIACYADDESPVVLVLDDLQWADASSLRILELVVTAPEPLNLLVLAAVRDGDGASRDAAAMRELGDRLSSSGIDIATIHLQPWDRRDVAGFVADSLDNAIEDADELAKLLVAKTHGNPFFVRELLRVLVQHKAIYLQPADNTWRWDHQALQRLPVTDNVVAFLSDRIAGLPADVKHALRICACLGRELSLSDFCVVNDQSLIAAEISLRRAVTEGLLVQRDGHRPIAAPGGATAPLLRVETAYEFVHDRVLEAARALLSSADSAATHLRIGRVLSRELRTDAEEDRIYKVASHYNLAGHLIEDKGERYATAELNLKAGRLAKQRGAFSQALDFLQAGLTFLSEANGPWAHQVAWRDHFALTLSLHEETAEVALLNGQLSVMTRLCDAILARVESPLQKVLAYEIRICGLKAEKKFSAAVDAALEILRELGVGFPRRPTMLHVALGFVTTKRRVFAGPVSRLADLPTMTDARIKAAGRIIQSVYSAAYLGRPNLFPFLVYRHVNDSLEHGNEDYSGVTYTAFGVVLSATAQFDRAMQLGTMGLGILRRFNADRLKARAFMAYYSFIFPWQHHIRETLPYYREGLDAGLAHGDFEYASYIMTLDSLARLHSGDPLTDLQPELERHGAKIKSLGQERSIVLQDMLCQMVHALRYGPEHPNPLSGRFYDESRELPRCLEPLDENLVFHNYLAKLTLCLFLGDHASALDAARRGRVHLESGGFANYLGAVFVAYESLACLLSIRRHGRIGAMMRRVRRNQRLLWKWSNSAPMNFLHKYHLVEAERCRVLGRGERAAEHFEKAIELSQTHGFVHETGLAQHRAAEFYFGRGMERLGRQYLRDCYLSYRRWGAEALTRRLESEYAQHFAILATSPDGPVRRAAARFSDSLDYRMLLKSSQAISGEILLPRLLERLLENILEHSGAQRAILVLEKRGELHVEAEADVDEAGTKIIEHEAVEDSARLCRAVVHYSARMATPVVLADAAREGLFCDEPYVRQHRPKSVLCTPILYQGKLVGLVYLENNRVSHVFTEARLEVVNLLAGQAAISIANARFHTLELEAQQAKINPHFLFNALSSIANLAVSDGNKAETAIVKLASLYRYILTNSVEELVALDQELEIVRNYLTLEKLRFGSKLEYSVTTDGDASRVKLPGLLIQPLVENSIRYGVAPKLTPGTVSVHAAIHGDRCCIVVHDDGDGGKHGSSGTGFGLKSIQERLALTYGQQFSFAITRTGGYRVEIEIPAAR
jgi:predicted ATPase/GAF domain-containing protein